MWCDKSHGIHCSKAVMDSPCERSSPAWCLTLYDVLGVNSLLLLLKLVVVGKRWILKENILDARYTLWQNKSALLHIANNIYTLADSKHAAVLVGIDNCAAFDTIPHRVLMNSVCAIQPLRACVRICVTSDSLWSWARTHRPRQPAMLESGRAQYWGLSCSRRMCHQWAIWLRPSALATMISSPRIRRFDLGATNAALTVNQLAPCTAAFRHWWLLNGLRLNASKSETMMLGTAAQFHSAGATIWTVDVAGTSFPLTNELKTLSVMFNSLSDLIRTPLQLLMPAIISYHLHALRHIQNALSDDVAERIGCSIVGAKLDYCSSLLYGSSVSALDK